MNLLQEHANRELLRQAEDIARLARARIEPQRLEQLPVVGRIVRSLAVPTGQLHPEDAALLENFATATANRLTEANR